MDINNVGLNQKVKEKFKLFEGIRPHEEDQKIYDKVMNMCFDETLTFLGENLSSDDMQMLADKVANEATDEGKTNIMTEYLQKIDNYRFMLDRRLDSYLDNVLLSSLT